MKYLNLIGIALITLGLLSFAYQGFTYTTREKAVDLGPVQITTEKTHTVPLPPILGALVLVSGVVLLVSNKIKG